MFQQKPTLFYEILNQLSPSALTQVLSHISQPFIVETVVNGYDLDHLEKEEVQTLGQFFEVLCWIDSPKIIKYLRKFNYDLEEMLRIARRKNSLIGLGFYSVEKERFEEAGEIFQTVFLKMWNEHKQDSLKGLLGDLLDLKPTCLLK